MVPYFHPVSKVHVSFPWVKACCRSLYRKDPIWYLFFHVLAAGEVFACSLGFRFKFPACIWPVRECLTPVMQFARGIYYVILRVEWLLFYLASHGVSAASYTLLSFDETWECPTYVGVCTDPIVDPREDLKNHSNAKL